MNPIQLDQLRDALRREAQHIEPVGLGVETVQRRGRRRRNRGRAVVAFGDGHLRRRGSVSSVIHRQGPHTAPSRSRPGPAPVPTPTLAFRVVDGTVAVRVGALHVTRRRHVRAVDRARRCRQLAASRRRSSRRSTARTTVSTGPRPTRASRGSRISPSTTACSTRSVRRPVLRTSPTCTTGVGTSHDGGEELVERGPAVRPERSRARACR